MALSSDDLDDEQFECGSSKPVPILSFEDDQLKSTTLLTLNTMRKGGHFCDVTFQVGNHSIPAHRAVLACSSMYLYELFSREENVKQQTIKLKVRDYKSFMALIDYAYTAQLSITESMINSVYHTARLLKMDRAADACAVFMVDHLTPNTCLATRGIANRYSDQKLTKSTDEYITANLDSTLKGNNMHLFPRLQLQIMGIHYVQPGEEEHLCQLAVDYLQKTMDPEQAENLDVEEENVRVLYLQSGSHLVDCLEVEDAVVNSTDLVTDYKKLQKHKQNATKDKCSGNRQPVTPSSQLKSQERVSIGEPEWSVISTKLHSGTTATCITVLSNNLVILTLTFHPHPERPPTPEEFRSAQSSGRTSPSASGDKYLVPLSRMNSARCGVGTTLLNGQLIALGGYDRGECLNTVESYDMDTNKWTALPPMNTPRGRFDVSQLDGKLFACGGSNGSQELKSAECFNPQTGKWTPIEDMSTCRSSAGVAVLGRKLYVIGGWSGYNGLKSCEVYDLDTKTWTSIAPLNTGRSQSAICEFNGKLVAIGGCDVWNCTNTVEMYDPEMDKWTFLTPMSTCRRGAGVATFKGKLYVVGGSDGQVSLNSVEVYDPKTSNWSHGPSLSTPRANVSVTSVKDRLFAVGGFSGKVFLDTIEYLSSSEEDWSGYVYHEIPSNRGDGTPNKQNGHQMHENNNAVGLTNGVANLFEQETPLENPS